MVGFLRVWRPKNVMVLAAAAEAPALRRHSVGAVLKAWSPFAVASVLILLWALPWFAKYIRFAALSFPLPGLHNLAIRVPPVVPPPTGETPIMELNALALPGTAVFAGACLCTPLLAIPLARALTILGQTVR